MGKILLSELIERTKDLIRSLEHSQSTLYQYQMAWGKLSEYFSNHHQVQFSKSLAQQYVRESKAELEAGAIKKWRYKLRRLSVRMLIEVHEQGHFTWNYQQHDPSSYLHQSAFILLYQDYLRLSRKKEKARVPCKPTGWFRGNFWNTWKREKSGDLAEVEPNDVSLFIPYISKLYQPSSMRTGLSGTPVISQICREPGSRRILPEPCRTQWFWNNYQSVSKVTAEEEQKLLLAADRTTPWETQLCDAVAGPATALYLLIANLKLGDLEWKKAPLQSYKPKPVLP